MNPSTDSEPVAKRETGQSLGRSWLAGSVGIFASRISGLARDVASAWYWGATGICQAAFTVAFAVPNSLRQLFSEGAFTAAFVPMLSERLATDREEEAWQLAHRAISVQALAVTAVSLCFAAVSGILYYLGAFQGNAETRLTLRILPLLMPFAILICSAGAFSAILNSLKSFLLPSAIQITLNAVHVIAILALAWSGLTNEDFRALYIFCGATLLGGAIELLILALAARRRGYRFRFIPDWHAAEVKELCLRILPGVIGAGVMQINSLIDKAFSLYLGKAAIGAMNYSHRLVYLPVGLFAVALGTAALPALSRAQAKGDEIAIVDTFNYAVRTVLFLALPCTLYLSVCGQNVIAMLFERGAFTSTATINTYWVLLFYLVGLPAFCLAKVATNPFHARKDTKTPMLVSVVCLLLNILLNAALIRPLGASGLALSTSLCSWLNVSILFTLNRKQMPAWNLRTIRQGAISLLCWAMIAATGAHLVDTALTQCFAGHSGFLFRAIAVALTFVTASGVYLGGCFVMKMPEALAMIALLPGQRRRPL